MGKGYRRKTRWRTLDIGASPDKEDEEDGVQMTQEHRERTFDRNHKTNYKRNGTTNGVGTSDSARTSPPRFQPKVMFNESEYTRITTPRQDMLFKKGYLAKKMVYSSNNASTSATPSTTDSQSASHSTADGSEMAEDQLFDYRDNGLKEYQPMNGLAPEIGYGTFYDPVNGYYYEYPVMLGPMYSDSTMQNFISSMPCEPVPLGPVQWINPPFISKPDQSFFVMDYQNSQIAEVPTEGNLADLPLTTCTDLTEKDEEVEDKNCNGKLSDKEQKELVQQDNLTWEIPYDSEVTNQPPISVEVGLETAFSQQLHVSHQVVPPQSHLYPGHYMFGMPMRSTEMNPGALIYPKRRNRKKLKSKKTIHPIFHDNDEKCDDEYEDGNSEVETSKISLEPFIPKSQPLNPNCEEFQFKPKLAPILTSEPSPNFPNAQINVEEKSQELTIRSSSELTMSDVEYAVEAIATERLSEPEDTEIGVDATYIEINNIDNTFDMTTTKNSSNDEYDNKICTNVPNHELNDFDKLLNSNSSEIKLSAENIENNENSLCIKNTLPKIHMITKKKCKNRKNFANGTVGAELNNAIQSDIKSEASDIEVMLGVEAIELQVSDSSALSIEYCSSGNKNNKVANNDSNFEFRTSFSDHPITDAVTQWLRRANSPELFVGLKLNTNNTENNDFDDDEDDDFEPSKNLHGNPILALSFNNIQNNDESSRLSLEFALSIRNQISKNSIKNHNDKQYSSHDINFGLNKKDSVADMRVAENTRFVFCKELEKEDCRLNLVQVIKSCCHYHIQ